MDWILYGKVFLIGGLLCVFGQLGLSLTRLTTARILVVYVTAGVVLGALGLYEPLVDWAGAGALDRLWVRPVSGGQKGRGGAGAVGGLYRRHHRHRRGHRRRHFVRLSVRPAGPAPNQDVKGRPHRRSAYSDRLMSVTRLGEEKASTRRLHRL